MPRRVLITGVAGQDGGYLAKACLEAGDQVWGVTRPGRGIGGGALAEAGLTTAINLRTDSLISSDAVTRLLEEIAPDQIYQLAADSSVARSFASPIKAAETNAGIPLTFLEALRGLGGDAAFIQASSCDIFGQADGACTENTPLAPVSPYAAAKAFAHNMVGIYRQAYGVRASNAILFVHESPHRPETFLARKVTLALARIKSGLQDVLQLGNMAAERDWGFAGDVANGLRLMAAQEKADDFVLATGESHSVQALVEVAAAWFGYEIEWSGEGVERKGHDRHSGKLLVEVNPDFFRPVDSPRLVGDPSKAETLLGWRRMLDFRATVELMCAEDLARTVGKAP